MTLEEWNKPKEVSVSDMTDAIKELKQAQDDYYDAKAISDGKHEVFKAKKAVVIAMCQEANITEFIAEGIAKVKVTTEPYVPTPKTPEQRTIFFDFLEQHFGPEAPMAYATVNANTLNSLYKQLLSEGIEIPGLDQPTTRNKLSLTKSR
jgi:hypothetical protein